LGTVGAEQIIKILELTDSFNLSRESVIIPLRTAGQGEIKLLANQRLSITVPESGRFEEWLLEVQDKLAKMDLSTIRR
jgi:hypothetical protein